MCRVCGAADRSQSGSTNVELLGFDGCTDNQYAVNLLISFIRHPNVGAVLAVGLGCEYVQPEWLSKIAEEEGKPTSWMFIQNEGGTQPAVRKGVEWVQSALKELENTPRGNVRKDLVIGAECGGSDYTSGLAGNVVVGRFYDWLTDQGGTAIFEEIVEAIGLDHLLLKRAASEQAAKELRYTYDKALEYCRSVRQYSVSPATLQAACPPLKKEHGCCDQERLPPHSGRHQGVLPCAPSGPVAAGLHPGPLLDAVWHHQSQRQRGLDGSCQLWRTHRVPRYRTRQCGGQRSSPCIKITGNGATYARMEGDMDFNANPVLRANAPRASWLAA